MKTFTRYTLVFATALSLTGCDEFLGDNIDPNKSGLEELAPRDLMPTSIYYTSSAHYSIALGMCQYSQQLATYFQQNTDAQEETQLAGGWSNIYLQALPDIQTMLELAESQNLNGYQGIAKVLQATNLGLATDNWGDVPASQATLGEGDFSPAFDAQEAVYEQINSLLDEAIVLLGQSDSSVGSDDLIYNGDLSKWLKTAYFLKAKYSLHLTEVDQASAVSGALSAISSSFTSNEDDYELEYNTRNFNPWYAGVVLPNNTGNFSVLLNDQLISAMDGTQFPFATIDEDPRIPLISSIGENDDDFLGAISGTGGAYQVDPRISATADLAADDFYSAQTAPIILGSYSELKFIEAEARFLQNGGTPTSTGSTTAAYNAYLAGIAANMDKVGVSAADKAAYLADASVAVGASNLTLALIMREKFIATFLNPESFVDLRRYDFSTAVFPGLSLPVDQNPDIEGRWVRRAQYPSSEQTRNGDEVARVMQTIDTGVWWDRD